MGHGDAAETGVGVGPKIDFVIKREKDRAGGSGEAGGIFGTKPVNELVLIDDGVIGVRLERKAGRFGGNGAAEAGCQPPWAGVHHIATGAVVGGDATDDRDGDDGTHAIGLGVVEDLSGGSGGAFVRLA